MAQTHSSAAAAAAAAAATSAAGVQQQASALPFLLPPMDMVPPVTLSGALLTVAAAAAVLFVVGGLLLAIGVLFQPRWLIAFVRRHQPHILFEHVTKDPLVALTIDDGPNGDTTHQLLDILQEHDAKATFFVIGSNMDKWPDVVNRMYAEGHELGNHTMEDVASWRLSSEEFENALLEADSRLQPYFRYDDESGSAVKWFRPGHGWYTKQMRKIVQRHGYRLALGSVFPVDPLFKESGGPLALYCLWKMYPGAIIVLHDRPQQQNQTVEILRRLLPELRKKGYRVVTLSQLMRGGKNTATAADDDSALSPLM